MLYVGSNHRTVLGWNKTNPDHCWVSQTKLLCCVWGHWAPQSILFYLTLYWILAELHLLNCCVLAKKKTIIVVHFFSEFASKMESRTTIPQRRVQAVRTSSNESQENDGSVSDSAVTTNVTEGRKRRPSIGHKMAALVGLNRRSSSATQLAG